MKPAGVILAAVRPGSPAAAAGLRAGDAVLAVDGRAVEDALDLAYAIAEERFTLTVRRPGGRARRRVVRREPGRAWGGEFAPPPVRGCGNRCIFCFVDQMPRGLRNSLYVKDEDYRYSFLYGSYVTLTNLRAGDLRRIKRLRLSPLYVSVHATQERVRRRLLGRRRTPAILPLLRELTAAGITVHAQAVLCPGINDGAVLERTIRDLGRLYPGVQSLALVPVGLTAHRQALPPLRRHTAAEAAALLRRAEVWQKTFRARFGSRFVYAADEWYLRARRTVPKAEAYEGFPQIENGVGLVRQFLDAAAEAARKLPARVPSRRVLIPAGELSAPVVRRAVRPLARIPGVDLAVVPAANRLFGPEVTVSGLLSGADVLAALRPRARGGERVLIAADMVREGRDEFLDGMSLRTLARALGVKTRLVRGARELARAIIQ